MPATPERETPPNNLNLNLIIQIILAEKGNITIDLQKLPNLEELLNSRYILTPVKGDHVGLKTSANLAERLNDIDSRITSLTVQAIEADPKKGRVQSHQHDDVYEIIMIESGRSNHYPGLDHNQIKLITMANGGPTYEIYFIPPGTNHGSTSEPARGRWVSLKIQA